MTRWFGKKEGADCPQLAGEIYVASGEFAANRGYAQEKCIRRLQA